MGLEDIPREDGYYWLMLGDHTMHRVYIWPRQKYTIVNLYTTTDLVKNVRKIRFIEANTTKYYNLKYFLERAKFGEFIKIMNPNEEL